ncbi:MAG TPA: ABC transporter permease [Mycobacteriales bacterium]|nr:ABC transporter permease [Mycobacteriales bacterium]
MLNVGESAGLLDRLRYWWEQESRRPTGGSPAARIAQIYRRRDMLRTLVARDLKKKYSTSYLGYVWTLLEPSLLIAVYAVVFGKFGRFGIHHYVLFLAVGVLPFNWFRQSINGGTDALTGNSKLISSINLPREIYPLSLVLVKTVEFLLTIPIIVVVAIIYGIAPTPSHLVFFPVALIVEFVLNLGLVLLFSAWTTLFNDLERGLTSFLRLWFYLSPVLYPTGRVGGGVGRTFYELNPLVGIIELQRAVWFPHQVPSWHVLVVSCGGALIAFIGGWAAFIKLEPAVLKEL